jgi:hypothetical protein
VAARLVVGAARLVAAGRLVVALLMVRTRRMRKMMMVAAQVWLPRAVLSSAASS